MSTQYTTVPWTSPSALLALRSDLFSPSTPSTLPRALSLIQAWKLRNSNLPHAIESTYLLLSAQHHHAQLLQSHQPPPSSPALPSPSSPPPQLHAQVQLDPITALAIRALYTQSFTRFITGFCDISRNRARLLNPPSMAEVAAKIGLPPEFVDVRHEATHEDLPGLGRLVRVTEEGLRWLWGSYWSKLGGDEGEEAGEDEGGERLEQVLKAWRRGRVEALKKGGEGDVASTARELRRWSGEAIAEALVGGKMIWPSRRDIRSSLNGAFTLWQPLLTTLSTTHPSFLKSVISTVQSSINSSNPTTQSSFDADKEALSLWLLHTLSAQTWALNLSKAERESLRSETMMWCCTNPGYWSRFVGKGLLRDGGRKFRGVWEDMLEASRLDGAHEGHTVPVMEADEAAEPDPEVLEDAPVAIEVKPAGSGGGVKRGWRRMAVAPTCPIGVVQ
ncbi:unnamed protein product [Zymoseptoria tritici ST99CH_1E4]|uniref:Las1-like protein n=2 Tax=Zymoseptoria tritici TaxID=1047171 RepID=F9X1V3_ZYMTI|nr:uncharacterized protein MYCGRDRAFT_108264 [Zymoseptoria tritici IPO323]EGP90101.1 hypothetical protein MYCGRDRAFT_108264 [Zymoseptoria tritici IPO323]SMR46577.1 unnamed protein product [Zymoseptoria tritici ST99CH_1E4]